MVFNAIKDIAGYISLGESKTAELLTKKIIPSLITGSSRRYYYTTPILIEIAFRMICKARGKTYNSLKEAFLEKDLTSKELIYRNPTEVISIINQKGGVGKTTTSANLAASLAFLGKKVLLMDVDPQCNTTNYFEQKNHTGKSIANLVKTLSFGEKITKEDVTDLITTIKEDNFTLDQLPAELKLGKIMEASRSFKMSHSTIHKIISLIKDDYDYIIMDTPPSPGIALENAIYATDKIVFATITERMPYEGLLLTLEEINEVVEETHKDIKIDGIAVNMYTPPRKNKVFKEDEVDYHDKIIDFLIDDLNLDEENLITILKSDIMTQTQELKYPIFEYPKKQKQAMLEANEFFKYCLSLMEREV